ncbi:MAG: peptidase C1 [Chlorobi bacterium]|nr:peptidase C1 [Chlorobiota bacterium]
MNKIVFVLILLGFGLSSTFAQDKAVFEKREKGFYQNVIMKGIHDFEKKEKKERKRLTMDFSGYDLPKSVDEFQQYWHNAPISQGNTGTCWSFSTTSYFESEVYRLNGIKVKLSEMWTAYWEYIEKAKGFVKTRGKSLFAEGSEGNAVTRIWKKYGVVPESDYNGMLPGQTIHNHSKMFKEMNTYLQNVKKENAWNEEVVVSTIKSILDTYMGTPPTRVEIGQRMYKPQEYLRDYLKLNLDDYIDVLSYMQQPFFERVEYEVPDNWWHNKDYYNVPLDLYMETLKNAIRNGETLAIGGDVSEPGKSAKLDVFMIPSFDIPSEYIDDSARQFRFSNHTTTDDHGIHLVGYLEKDGKDWYLIKDSGSSSRDGANKGYYFFSEDYVKLKIMDFMIHKDFAKDILDKFK